MQTAVIGSSITVKEAFMSTSNTALMPDPVQLPVVVLFDSDKTVLYKTTAMTGNVPGEWLASVNIPVLDIHTPVELHLLWLFKDSSGNTHRVKDTVLVNPTKKRDSEYVIMDDDTEFTVVLPFKINEDTFKAKLYLDNNVMYTWYKNAASEFDYDVNYNNKRGSSLTFSLENTQDLEVSLAPYMMIFTGLGSDSTTESRYTSWMFKVNSSIISATMAMEEYVNKARYANIIPELDYKLSDFLLYLERGLALFNSYPPQITGFNGRAMAGPLLDSWLLCSSYYLLTAQIQAEGASAFDFSGQSVTLNVDRTQYLESAIGRLEGLIENTVKPFKKTLVKTGVTGGDGNIKKALSFGPSFGRLFLTNNPLSRAAIGGGYGSRIMTNFPFRRGQFY